MRAMPEPTQNAHGAPTPTQATPIACPSCRAHVEAINRLRDAIEKAATLLHDSHGREKRAAWGMVAEARRILRDVVPLRVQP